MWSRRPGVAEAYLKQVAEDFEKYAASTYLTALRDPNAPDDLVLAGLRFIQTRHLTDHEDTLIELFSSPRRGKQGGAINEACFDALIASPTHREKLAAVFADIGSYPSPHANARFCADGLRALGPVGIETLLERIANESDGKRRLKRARLLARTARRRMPESSTFWKSADPDAIAFAVQSWREALVERELLDALPDALDDDSVTSNGFVYEDAPGLLPPSE